MNDGYFEESALRMTDGSPFAQFVRLDPVAESGQRVIKKVRFERVQDELQMSEWSMSPGSYGSFSATPVGIVLMTNVTYLSFHPIGGGGMGDLPNALRIIIGVRRLTDVSGIGARSFGPNAKDDGGGEDDITSY
jgi:hypothetical protein